MKEFLEPRLEILQFHAESILLDLSALEGEDENTGGGVATPVIPVG
jgi:hypothetical protein